MTGPVLFTSASAARRLEAARAHIKRALEAGKVTTLIAPSREAGRALVRQLALSRGASARVEPTTLPELALLIARPSLVRRGESLVAGAGLEAIVAQVLAQQAALDEQRDASRPSALGRYAEVRERAGTPRAIAASLEELWLADLAPDALLEVDPALAAIAAALASALEARGLVTRATVWARASAALRRGEGGSAAPRDLVVLDLALDSTLEAALARALVDRAQAATITLPHGDLRTRARWVEGLDLAEEHDAAGTRCARRLFEEARAQIGEAPASPPAIEVRSGTTEADECLELARVILGALEGDSPTPLDEIAIVVRDVERYRAPLGEALRRAQIPFHLERAARRPDPAGRAFLSLLECAAEGLSARAFSDYLAFGVLPAVDDAGAPVPSRERAEAPDDESDDEEAATKQRAVIGGALRAPRRWERLLVDAAVLGGEPARWRRRLGGLAAELEASIDAQDDPDGPEAQRARARLRELERLSRFALPIIELLAALPDRAPYMVLLPQLEALARAALLEPRRVLEVLAQLAPLASDTTREGEVTIDEVRRVLLPRLFEITSNPPDRGGCVRVLAADALAGRAFALALAPGLVEGSFPRRVLEDPILGDQARAAIAPRLSDAIDGPAHAPLASSLDRADDERRLLRLLSQCAPRLVVSHPRRDERNREQVPSLYLLELLRADRGVLVSSASLAKESAQTRRAPGWPAPLHAEHAIDQREAELASLAALLAPGVTAEERRGRAHYLVRANPTLRRSLLARHNAGSAEWRSADGLVTKDPATLALLSRERLAARVYSATALESFAACPYRFYLRAIVRLKARESLEPIEVLEPMTRGSLVHAMQYALVRFAQERGLSVHDEEPALRVALDAIVEDTARDARDRLAPAIDSVFDDEIAALREDLHLWLHHLCAQKSHSPVMAELGFGEPGGAAHDPASVREPVTIEVPRAEGTQTLRLRGSIDLVELGGLTLRATDYKTGRAEVASGARIRGGKTLQPLLYALVLEAMLRDGQLGERALDATLTVEGGRLWYCTRRGEDRRVDIALDDEGRAAIGEVAASIEHALERGFLPRAPSREGGCAYCDYLAVCGPDAAERAALKSPDRRMEPLVSLRSRA